MKKKCIDTCDVRIQLCWVYKFYVAIYCTRIYLILNKWRSTVPLSMPELIEYMPRCKLEQVEQARGRALRIRQTWEVAPWEIAHLGSCHLRKTFGMLPLGKMPLGKYLTSLNSVLYVRNPTWSSLSLSLLLIVQTVVEYKLKSYFKKRFNA